MITTISKMKLTTGEELDLPLSVDAAKQIFGVEFTVFPVDVNGRPASYTKVKSSLTIHVTQEALGVNLEAPSAHKLLPTIEDRIFDILVDLGVKFED